MQPKVRVSPPGVSLKVGRLEFDAPLVVLLEFGLEPPRFEHLGDGGLKFFHRPC